MNLIERNNRITKKYQVSLVDYGDMLATQGGTCAICERWPEENEHFCIDHDHRSGLVRGLLCSQCNLGIGNLKDDTDLLLNAINYLKRNRSHGIQRNEQEE